MIPIQLSGSPSVFVQIIPSTSDINLTLNKCKTSPDSSMEAVQNSASPSPATASSSFLEIVQLMVVDVAAVGMEMDSGPKHNLHHHSSPCCHHSDFLFKDSMLTPDEVDAILHEDIPNYCSEVNHGKHDIVITNFFHNANKVAFSKMYCNLQEH